MSQNQQATEIEALQVVINQLSKLEEDSRERILNTVSTFFGVSRAAEGRITPSQTIHFSDRQPSAGQPFSDREDLSPKEFLMAKEPNTDIERVACLAFYLTYYRNKPHFKTIDISKLNIEAAQPKFSNAANAVDNASKKQFLVHATKGDKQLSAFGEQFVQALPDRDATKAIQLRNQRPRKKRTSSKK